MNTIRRKFWGALFASACVIMLLASSSVQAQSTIRYTRIHYSESGHGHSRDTVTTITTERLRPTRRVYVEPAYSNSRVVVAYDEPTYIEPVYYDNDDYVQYVRYPTRSHHRSYRYSYVYPRHYRHGGYYRGHHGHGLARGLRHIGRGIHRLGHIFRGSHYRHHNRHRGFGISFGRGSHGRHYGGFSYWSH